ncbi:TetR/AcrR family transcriptional regulator [Umboniibacter marinipuniceus]|uniref:TetR family transcriptional regulator n=1 Tax=Umboniibacter marinipuniceus TaxID=569599 RepID=A0A3M0AQB1_9GAMM|nr:TetR/AcrR family transcriptional regulator [Umboniibacter marinipuniceus]RMA81182.1 TetR family transcriptional regulator [Umboniibacter marinipuniceus]
MVPQASTSIERAHKKVQLFRAREQAILDAALELLLKYGEDRVTVESIAEHINIGKGTIYKHFRSKSEIYIQLLLDYERQLTESLQEALKESSAAAARIYFDVRLSNPERDRLFQRLEERLLADGGVEEQIGQLHSLRSSNRDGLNAMIGERIRIGALEDVDPAYHFCICWALAQGAVELWHSPFFSEILKDKDDFMEFVKDIGINMGRAGVLHHTPNSKSE